MRSTIVPAPFLFRYSVPVKRVDRLPRKGSPALQLPESCSVAWPAQLEGNEPFADLALAWNPDGFAVNLAVRGKHKPLACDARGESADAVLLWIDTRNTQGAHRASRFSHHFIALPTGGGKQRSSPVVVQQPIPRAREDAPQADASLLQAESQLLPDGYNLGLWFPAATLHGYDPASQSRLGFYAAVVDGERGVLPLVVDNAFSFDSDPTQWITLELRNEG